MSDTLANRKWINRAFIFHGTDTDALNLQTDWMKQDKAALQERDLLVYCLDSNAIHIISGDMPDDETPSQTRQRFWLDGSPEFEAILVGKDGTVKQTFKAPVTRQELFGFIDAMPMRQDEMQS